MENAREPREPTGRPEVTPDTATVRGAGGDADAPGVPDGSGPAGAPGDVSFASSETVREAAPRPDPGLETAGEPGRSLSDLDTALRPAAGGGGGPRAPAPPAAPVPFETGPVSTLSRLARSGAGPGGASGTGSAGGRAGSGAEPKYELAGEIGRGGMGVVVRALDRDLRRDLAMKVARPEVADREGLLRFLEEAQVTAQLEHPNIVPVHELGVDAKGRVYFTMKLVRGEPLDRVLAALDRGDGAAKDRYGLATLLGIVVKVCDAVAFAHSRGVVHRDLKPANVMVGEFGEVVVMDWGLAKPMASGDGEATAASTERLVRTLRSSPVEGETGSETGTGRESGSGSGSGEALASDLRTRHGHVLGTPAYMSPEQAAGELDRIDARSDVYSLGALLYEVLTLRRPFEARTTVELLLKIGRESPVPARRRRPDLGIPAELEAIAAKAMANERERRYASALELGDDLRRWLEGRPVLARPDPLAIVLWKWAKRNRAVATTAAAGLLALASVLAFIYTRPARVRLTSNPGGARVLVDGREVGRTPTEALVLDAAPTLHALRFELDGHEPLETRLAFPRGEQPDLLVNLRSRRGNLIVTSAPAGARVRVVDAATGRPAPAQAAATPLFLELPAGDYRLEAELRGHRLAGADAAPFPVEGGGANTRRHLVLEEMAGLLALDRAPDGRPEPCRATVYALDEASGALDPAPVLEAPVPFPGGAAGSAGTRKVPAGRLLVRVDRDGFVPRTFEIAVAAGETASRGIRLEPVVAWERGFDGDVEAGRAVLAVLAGPDLGPGAGDGRRDLVVALGDPEDPTGTETLVVLDGATGAEIRRRRTGTRSYPPVLVPRAGGAGARLALVAPDALVVVHPVSLTVIGYAILEGARGRPLVADLRGDGREDIVVLDGSTLRGFDPAGAVERFRKPVDLGDGFEPATLLALPDADGDGAHDLVMAGEDGAALALSMFRPAVLWRAPAFGAGRPLAAAVAGTVVIASGTEVRALEAATGKTRWRRARDLGGRAVALTTALAGGAPADAALVTLEGGRAVALDLATGATRFEVATFETAGPVAPGAPARRPAARERRPEPPVVAKAPGAAARDGGGTGGGRLREPEARTDEAPRPGAAAPAPDVDEARRRAEEEARRQAEAEAKRKAEESDERRREAERQAAEARAEEEKRRAEAPPPAPGPTAPPPAVTRPPPPPAPTPAPGAQPLPPPAPTPTPLPPTPAPGPAAVPIPEILPPRPAPGPGAPAPEEEPIGQGVFPPDMGELTPGATGSSAPRPNALPPPTFAPDRPGDAAAPALPAPPAPGGPAARAPAPASARLEDAFACELRPGLLVFVHARLGAVLATGRLALSAAHDIAGAAPPRLELADLDGDGLGEALIAGPARVALARLRAPEAAGAYGGGASARMTALLDVDGDGRPEVVAAGEERIACLRGRSLAPPWTAALDARAVGAPFLYPGTDDAPARIIVPVVTAAGDAEVRAFDARGGAPAPAPEGPVERRPGLRGDPAVAARAARALGEAVEAAIAVDLDGDGRVETLVIFETGEVAVYDDRP